MERKKLIVKMAVLGIVVFLIASAGRIAEVTYNESIKEKLTSKRKNLITDLSNEYQKYLNETAAKIRGLPIDQHLINQISSDVLKKSPVTKLYLWMSNPEGKFIFGVPYPVFERLNKSYDKYRDVIEADGYYVDRNDFLLKLVHQHERIKFSQFEARVLEGDRKERRVLLRGNLGRPQIGYLPKNLQWRFYKEHSDFQDYRDPLRIELSAPVVDNDQHMIGTLFLKIDDYTTPTQNSHLRARDILTPGIFHAFEIMFGFSLAFLWFLLPSWVYIDARQRDVKNAVIWALLTVVSVGFAWIVYLIVRPATLKSFHCPQCEKELNGTKAFCPFCGFDLSHVFCPHCQYPVQSEWQFCPSCRTDLSKKPQSQDETPEEKSK
ncbi:MAG: zinc ribbon domain-containing protein [Candidatus Aminicenantes bacterium]|jgi:hypothetical protein